MQSKGYAHDRLLLLLLSTNIFLTLLNAVLILLKLDSVRGTYIVQYRANLGLSAYRGGDSSTFFSFIAFGFLVLAFHAIISVRIYKTNRQYSIITALLSILLLILTIIVSNALLTLR